MVDVEDHLRPIARRLTWTQVILGFGVLFRLAQYLAGRHYWLDEVSLHQGLVARSLGGLHRPLGGAAVWFSFPSVFVLAGSATCLLAESLIRREWRVAAPRLAVGAVWAASFAVSYRTALGQLARGTGLWAFWEFAFPPRTLAP